MKLVKVAVAMAAALTFGRAYAFHDGGVARCEGCHTMHNSSTGATGTVNSAMTRNALPIGTTNPYLLQGSDPSSTCLKCHGATTNGSYHVYDSNAVAAGGAINNTTVNLTPGGDFSWTKVSTRKGHSIVAADDGLNTSGDTRLAPPGYTGSWNGANFSCVSCHDPHGQARLTGPGVYARQTADASGVAQGTGLPPIAASGSYGGASFQDYAATGTAGAYRLLGGNGWTARSTPGQPVFAVNPPVALAPSTYNKSELTFTMNGNGHTGQTVVAYLSGMSEWCATCHGQFHGQASSGTLGSTDLRHPSGATATLGALAQNYNKYISTGNLTGTKAYDALMPVELNVARDLNAAALPVDTTGTVNITAAANSNVMCLTCHRAHASAFDSMLRWDMSSQFNSIGTPGDLNNGAANANRLAGYYYRGMSGTGNQYGSYQRAMCNKCHVKD